MRTPTYSSMQPRRSLMVLSGSFDADAARAYSLAASVNFVMQVAASWSDFVRISLDGELERVIGFRGRSDVVAGVHAATNAHNIGELAMRIDPLKAMRVC